MRSNDEKTCTKCGEAKPLAAFRLRKLASGLVPTSWCKVCLNTLARECERKKADAKKQARKEAAAQRPPKPPPQPRNAIAKKYRERHPERARAAYRKYANSEKGRLQHRLQSAKRRARMRGVVTPDQWRAVLKVYGDRCAYCRAAGTMTVDHVKPVSKGGVHELENVVPACEHCNFVKSNAPLEVAAERLGFDTFKFKARWWFARQRAALG